jgi:hypothetical protein
MLITQRRDEEFGVVVGEVDVDFEGGRWLESDSKFSFNVVDVVAYALELVFRTCAIRAVHHAVVRLARGLVWAESSGARRAGPRGPTGLRSRGDGGHLQ